MSIFHKRKKHPAPGKRPFYYMSTYGLKTLQCQIFRHKEYSHILIKLKTEFGIPKNMYYDASRGMVILYEQEK